jgi:hypothetical protein
MDGPVRGARCAPETIARWKELREAFRLIRQEILRRRADLIKSIDYESSKAK